MTRCWKVAPSVEKEETEKEEKDDEESKEVRDKKLIIITNCV